jgi:hypothetical protein
MDIFPKDYNFYNFLVDVIIPIGTFLIGLLAERKWHVIGNLFKIKIHDESETEQSQETSGDNNQTLQARDIYGSVSINASSSAETAPEQLPYKEKQFVDVIIRVLGSKNITSNFADRYGDGYKHLKNSCSSLAASSYLSAFLQVKEVFLAKVNYRAEVNEDLIKALESSFNNLQQLSDNSTNNIEELKGIINGIETTMGSLFGYIL